MELATIELDVDEAKERYAEYAGAMKKRHSEEDAAIAAGYKALAEGKSLISMTETIAAGGADELGRPKLAVAASTADVVYLDRRRGGTVRFCASDQPRDGWTRDVSQAGVRVAAALEPLDHNLVWTNKLRSDRWGGCCWKAMVPLVPPRFRVRGWRSSHVLFEAEWAEHTPPAPVDPALLRHLRGDLWVVLGVWDLTPLERAVLGERLLTEARG